MNKLKRNIIIISSSLVFVFLICFTVFAAFYFQRTVEDEDVELGEINIVSQNFLNYAPNIDSSKIYYKSATTREAEFSYYTVVITEDTFTTNGTLYIKNNEQYLPVTSGSFSSSTQYYQQKISYKDVPIKESTFTTNGTLYTMSQPASYSSSYSYYILEEGLYNPVDVNETTFSQLKENLYVYSPVTSGTFDSSINYYQVATYLEALEARKSTPTVMDGLDTIIECYATQRGGYNDEVDLIYLNQLGLEFTFQTNIAVYVRIHIQDAWYSSRYYTNSDTRKNYIQKGKIEGVSPFASSIDTDWVYDEKTNCAYLKQVVNPTSSELTENESTYTFNVNPEYFYNATSTVRESVIVQVSYSVDIVQANRAEQKWKVDLDEIFANN